VVWECELTRKTVETIHRVAYWLSQGKVCYDYVMNQNDLLSIAEKKIRYRISSYNDKTELIE